VPDNRIVVNGHVYALVKTAARCLDCKTPVQRARSKRCQKCHLAKLALDKKKPDAVKIRLKKAKPPRLCVCGGPISQNAKQCFECRFRDHRTAADDRCKCGAKKSRTADLCKYCRVSLQKSEAKANSKTLCACGKPKTSRAIRCKQCRSAEAKAKSVCACGEIKNAYAPRCRNCCNITRRKSAPYLIAVKPRPGETKVCGPGRKGKTEYAGCGERKPLDEFSYNRRGRFQKHWLCRDWIAEQDAKRRDAARAVIELTGARALPVDKEEYEELLLDWYAGCEYALANNLPQPPKPLSEVDRFIEEQASEMEALLEAKEAGNK
jgi:hypothetical protein